jgi:hypothetical protein
MVSNVELALNLKTNSMNREDELNKTFPLGDGTTYIGNLDNVMCEYSGLPSVQSYESTGAGGESIKENFIDSNQAKVSVGNLQSGSWDDNKIHTEQDFMYNWIRKHSGK